MLANIRNSISNAADDVSHRFEQTRRRHRRNNSRSSASSSSSASASSTRPRQRQRQQQQPSAPQQQQQQQPPPEAPQRAPPASMRAIKQLPTIRVAPEDLIDPINRECCICFEDNCLDEKVIRLPCAHIFHTSCIVDWLANHSCTCPVCRYELPTDDPQYEQGRIERMQYRKPRFAMHELQRLKISDLLTLNNRRRLPVSAGVLEKGDLIQMLIDTNLVDVIPSPEPVEYQLEVLKHMKIGELKRTMAEAGVFFRREDVLMKSDMITVFENSGRLILTFDESDTSPDIMYSNNHEATTHSSSTRDLEKNRIIVETVSEDLLEPATDDEKLVEPAIEMFPNQNEEVDSASVDPTIPNSQQRLSLSTDSHENNVEPDQTSESDTQNPMHSDTLSQHHAAGIENTAIDVDIPDFDENMTLFNAVNGSDTQSVAQGLEQMDDHNEHVSTRTARRTFQHYTVNNLQTLGRDLLIDLSHCLDREEMIDTFINTGINGNVDPSTLLPRMFSTWSVSQLRVVASESKINLSECTTKREMIERIVYAGNVERPYLRDYLRSLCPLTTKNLADLRAIARELRINISDCLEKDEIIQRLITRNQQQIGSN